jgi:hypothetical protein
MWSSAETDPTYDQVPICAILNWKDEVQQEQQLVRRLVFFLKESSEACLLIVKVLMGYHQLYKTIYVFMREVASERL